MWLVWLASAVAAHVYVACYASPIPFRDDFGLLPLLEGDFRLSALWAQHNEHRLPLPQLLMAGLLEISPDLRLLMWAEVWLLAAVAVALMATAQRVRGRASYFDAFFPLLLLSWGNAANLLMGHQLSLMLPSAITCAILMLVVAGPREPHWGGLAAIGALGLALPLNGGPGVTQAPAIALWCVLAAAAASRTGGGSRARWIACGAALGIAALVAVYFIGFENRNYASYARRPWSVVVQAARFLTLAFGPAGRELWPYSGLLQAALCIATAWRLAQVVRREPAERLRALGLAAVAAGIVATALATGFARGPASACANRYVTLPAPLLCMIYFIWLRYGPPAPGRFVQAGLYSLMLGLLCFHVDFGVRLGRERQAAEQRFLHDVRAGFSEPQLAAMHARTLGIGAANLERSLARLWAIGFEPLAVTPPDPAVFAALGVVPRGVVAELPPGPCTVGALEALLTHPECELFFDPPPGATRVRGWFGIYPRAYRIAATAGARFSVELVAADGTVRILWERTLRPTERAEDRGIQPFEAALPAGGDAAALILLTSFAPDQGDPNAWACWRAVSFE